ncbi:TetR/AcrR family transcriptional regulator [Pseudarthrobacter cellobiosi]|uniref:TetR/AcrR family transcriptional regulator n=1 Tax=Pseudarthrobacter cellobiosi TaxID=2953654 RepID=UPI00208E0BE0|nr:TetR/AcrR family transcriptional regulator [Pseudarthrobacter sp. HLT1-5]MCO4255971.1 TetR family transcriptional regulator [Pseudarthrobacter sp. HLT1-5]
MAISTQEPTDRPRAKSFGERQRHPTEVRRQLVIDAARDLIADKGLFNVVIRDISQTCGVSPGTITYHFKGLEEVLMEVVKAETADFYVPLQEAAHGTEDPGKGLVFFLEGLFGSDQNTRRHWLIWLDFWAAAARDDRYGQWMNDHYAAWRKALQEIAERGVDEGVFRCEDPARFAVETTAMADGLAVQCYSRQTTIPVDRARELLIAFVKRELHIN